MLLSNLVRTLLLPPRAFRHQLLLSSATSQTDDFTEAFEAKAKREAEQRKRADEDEILKDKIFEAGLKHVPEVGWTREALQRGAVDLKYPDVVAGLAANGDLDLVHYHINKSDAKLRDKMKAEVKETEAKNERIRIGPFIQDKVKYRLSLNIPYLQRWPEAMALMSLPQNLPSSLELDLRLMDDIWHYAGDKSRDYNWYTKRLSLLAIYKSTELAMLQDKSQDLSETWNFLSRRFEDERQFSQFILSSSDAQNVLRGVTTTLQNIIGLPRK